MPAQLVVLADSAIDVKHDHHDEGAGPDKAFQERSESPAQPVILADPVVVIHDEREGVLPVAGHQQLELLTPHGVPRGVGDGALQLAVRAQVQPACTLKHSSAGAGHEAASRGAFFWYLSHAHAIYSTYGRVQLNHIHTC